MLKQDVGAPAVFIDSRAGLHELAKAFVKQRRLRACAAGFAGAAVVLQAAAWVLPD
jgi:hypothetical protein